SESAAKRTSTRTLTGSSAFHAIRPLQDSGRKRCACSAPESTPAGKTEIVTRLSDGTMVHSVGGFSASTRLPIATALARMIPAAIRPGRSRLSRSIGAIMNPLRRGVLPWLLTAAPLLAGSAKDCLNLSATKDQEIYSASGIQVT